LTIQIVAIKFVNYSIQLHRAILLCAYSIIFLVSYCDPHPDW